METLAIDKRSALMDKPFYSKSTIFSGNGNNVTYSRKMKESSSCEEKTAAHISVAENSSKSICQKEISPQNISDVVTSMHLDIPMIYLDDQSNDPCIRKRIDDYNPTNWRKEARFINGNYQVFRKGNNRLKLILLWEIACEEAILCLLEKYPSFSISWCIGWVFHKEYAAAYKNLKDVHALCLNPVYTEGRNKGNMRYSLRQKMSQKRLMALAKHEVSHILSSLHDETFANILTDIDELYDEKSVFSRMKTSLTGGKK